MSETACFQQLTSTIPFTAVLETDSSDFYGHTFQVLYALCYKHICLKLSHEHDYLMCTQKSKGSAGHTLTTELYA